MSNININLIKSVLTEDDGTEKPLLDMQDFFSNKSRIPMHTINNTNYTIRDIIAQIQENSKKLFPNPDTIQDFRNLAFDSLLTACLIKTSSPLKITEFGSTDGILSYHITELAGAFNSESQVRYISDTIGNNSGNICLDVVTQALHIPKMSFIYSDYEKTGLAEAQSDITIINGSVGFTNHYEVIMEARHLTKKNGTIICVCYGDYLLESTFRLIFENRKDYKLTPSETIMTAENTINVWEPKKAGSVYTEYQKFSEQFERSKDSENVTVLRSLCKEAERLAQRAANENLCDIKIQLISHKEELINQICRSDK